MLILFFQMMEHTLVRLKKNPDITPFRDWGGDESKEKLGKIVLSHNRKK